MTNYLANLDFDDRLAGKAGGSQPRPGPPDENAVLWRLIASEGDEILVPGLKKPVEAHAIGPLPRVTLRPPRMRGETDLIPWGTDDLALRLACGKITDEMVEVAKRLNDRLFAFECQAGLRMASANDPLVNRSVLVTDADEILPRAAAGELLMLKPRHGGFGRGLRRVLGPDSNPNLQGWVRARCREGGLIVEPLLTEIEFEWANHWELQDASGANVGRPTFLGTTALRCEVRGQFQESDSSLGVDDDVSRLSELPKSIIESGYHGPLSIDACRYAWNGRTYVGLLRDINARWTVGRLVLDAAKKNGRRVRLSRLSRTDRIDKRHESKFVIPSVLPTSRPRWCVTIDS